ncbi:META domain-containing protein [Pararhodonellum marinum]|uniref:META domain-containing protein n=1 Tax=Pararhodonellum marinum TaxID=2755358 RepID=UPI00189052B9|nr:META domain-containing protein [Pararhodonellum marinum]
MKIIQQISLLILIVVISTACTSEPIDLADHNWKGKSIAGTSANQEKVSNLTLEFGEGQEISGEAPCNSFRGGATYNREQIKFSALYTDRKICDDYDLEKIFLTNLEASSRYTISGNTLAFFDDNGNLLLEMEKM